MNSLPIPKQHRTNVDQERSLVSRRHEFYKHDCDPNRRGLRPIVHGKDKDKGGIVCQSHFQCPRLGLWRPDESTHASGEKEGPAFGCVFAPLGDAAKLSCVAAQGWGRPVRVSDESRIATQGSAEWRRAVNDEMAGTSGSCKAVGLGASRGKLVRTRAKKRIGLGAG